KDAEWIATCLQKDLVKGSYVPEDLIQQLRQYDRRIFDLSKDIVYKLTKLDAALHRCNIRISNYISTTKSKGYKEIVRLISEGVTDPGGTCQEGPRKDRQPCGEGGYRQLLDRSHQRRRH
ncbi:MAG: hypothetical protein IJV54_01370, partial [Bacteroidales bacterium]|nr:hypothetical protein [Bacteroidales bacterium]